MKKVGRNERYDISRSPLAQNPTQRQLAELVGLKRDVLRKLIRDKEDHIVRRDIEIKGKIRPLAYPKGKLRRVHERIKFHLSKIRQPDYLFSPRQGIGQRDNAQFHSGRDQYLRLDIKQFYPSTKSVHVVRWCVRGMGMRADVAGMLAKLMTVDDAVSFGSPATPVLVTLIYRSLFDSIDVECRRRGLRFPLWVDDITISGKFVPGSLLEMIRKEVAKFGLRTHKLEYQVGSRDLTLTGIVVRQGRLDLPRSAHNEISRAYAALRSAAQTPEELSFASTLLSKLGSYRYVVGLRSPQGHKIAGNMNAIRRSRLAALRRPAFTAAAVQLEGTVEDLESGAPF